ncbi:alpha/beta-Hydrolases superfamily protein [Striga hermonthica]|uniref:Alpha/beta-Hydrolases superfamily protein n=1 Tax=Striga hermonthica TaxID=68872 RepID=A0A9N7RIA2_STRHE|nr:alpha/beta-Hydrolases superfamily protein [Striga hermonthica]
MTFAAYVIGRDDAPGIVVLHVWWGVDFEIKNHAQKIARFDKGYKALIPDLYRGKVGLGAAEAQHLMDGLDWKGAVKDIETYPPVSVSGTGVNWLKEKGSKKVGVTGFSMGSALAIASSVLVPGVDVVASFYGVPSPELADVTEAKAPVQAHFGQRDTFAGFLDVERVGHAFMNRSPEGIERMKRMGINDENAEAPDKICSSRSRSCIAANKVDLGRFLGGLYVVGSLRNLISPSHRHATPPPAAFDPGDQTA